MRYIEPNLYISKENPKTETADVKLAMIDIATGKIYFFFQSISKILLTNKQLM